MTEQASRGGQQGQNPLKSDKGTTTIDQAVVKKIAGIAAQEVEKR